MNTKAAKDSGVGVAALASNVFPAGTLVNVRAFEVAIPAAATVEQIEEWLSFSLHFNGTAASDNPLINYDVDPFSGWLDWDMDNRARIGVKEKYDVKENPDGSRTYRVRTLRLTPEEHAERARAALAKASA